MKSVLPFLHNGDWCTENWSNLPDRSIYSTMEWGLEHRDQILSSLSLYYAFPHYYIYQPGNLRNVFSNIFLIIKSTSGPKKKKPLFSYLYISRRIKIFLSCFRTLNAHRGLRFGLLYFNLMPEKIPVLKYYHQIHKTLITSEMS